MVEDRARKLEESLELLNNNYDTLETVLRTECDNRYEENLNLKLISVNRSGNKVQNE